MNLTDIIALNYELGPITNAEPTRLGSGSTYMVHTTGQRYVAKTDQRPDFLKIYNKVQTHLNAKNILQSRLISTKDGQLQTPEGLVLYEHVDGACRETLTTAQAAKAIQYLRLYNQGLQEVPFTETELETKNNWDKARSTAFLAQELSCTLARTELPANLRRTLLAAAQVLKSKQDYLSANRQLIHADPGPDNFLFEGDEVRCLLDFSPDYQHELYSLGQFVYWNNLWSNQAIPQDLARRSLSLYYFGHEGLQYEDLFCVLLLQAALFKATAPLLNMLEAGNKNWADLEKRVSILEEVQKLQKN